MSISQAAARVYASALFDIASKQSDVARVDEELHAVLNALRDPELKGFFDMPQLRREDKRRVITMAFSGKVSRPIVGLLSVLVDKRRELLLNAIVAEFDEQIDQHMGRVRASVTSARPLDADLAEALQTALEQRTQQTVVLRQRIDPDLIGGMRVSLGDLVFDGSLRRGLADMRRTLAPRQV